MAMKEIRTYVVGGRNGYHGIDEYKDGKQVRNVDCVKTRKGANEYADSLRQAYADGRKDALIGLTLALVREVEGYQRPTLAAGTLVKILDRNGAWFDIVTADGIASQCQYCDLIAD